MKKEKGELNPLLHRRFDALKHRKDYIVLSRKKKLQNVEIPTVLFMLDEDLRVIYVNQGFSGYTPSEIEGNFFTDIIPTEIAQGLMEAIPKARKSPKTPVKWEYVDHIEGGVAVYKDEIVYINGVYTNFGVLSEIK